MAMRSRAAGSVLAVTLFCVAGRSLAQPVAAPPASTGSTSAPPQADPTVRARAQFTAGVRLAKLNEWQKAYDAFLEAWTLKEHPQIALNLGGAEMKIGKPRDASEHLRYCIDNNPPEHPDAALAREWLDEAKKEIVTLKITVEGAEAEVRVDGKPIGKSPLPPEVYIDPGKHTVEARSGTARGAVTYTFEAGVTRELELVPREVPAPVAARPVPVRSSAESGKAGGQASSGEEQSGLRQGIVGGGAALGGSLVLAGAIFAGLSASKAGEAGGYGAWDKCYEHQPSSADVSDCPGLHQLHQEMAVFGNLSTGMFIGGALVGSAALLYALRILPPGSSLKRSAVFMVPVIAPSSGGFSVIGQF